MRTRSNASRTTAIVIVCFLFGAARAGADEVHVMTSGAFTAALIELTPVFERATGHRIVLGATTSTGPDSVQNRILRGEPVDLVIMADTALDGLIRDGRLLPASRVELVRSAIGMAVRAGAPHPDISSLAAFTRALVQAKSIAYSASVSGVYLSTELFQRLGIADQVLPKSRRIEGERVGTVVARGDAEIGFQQVSELLPVPGIELLGPLPPEVQRLTVFAAAIAGSATAPAAARALIAFFSSAEAVPIIKRTGLEPIARAAAMPPKGQVIGVEPQRVLERQGWSYLDVWATNR